MTHDIADADRSLQASASKRQYGAGIPSKKTMCVRKSHAARTQSSIAMLALCGLNDICRNGEKALGIFEQLHLGRIRLEVAPLPPLYRQNAVPAQ